MFSFSFQPKTVERLPAGVPDAAVQDPRAADQDVSRQGQGESADHSDAIRQVSRTLVRFKHEHTFQCIYFGEYGTVRRGFQ